MVSFLLGALTSEVGQSFDYTLIWPLRSLVPNTRLSVTLPRCARELTANLVFCHRELCSNLVFN